MALKARGRGVAGKALQSLYLNRTKSMRGVHGGAAETGFVLCRSAAYLGGTTCYRQRSRAMKAIFLAIAARLKAEPVPCWSDYLRSQGGFRG